MTRLPTTDIYFRNACTSRKPRWWPGTRLAPPLRTLGDNSFIAGDTLLLIRRDAEPVMRRALAWPGRLAYLIDDDIAGATASPALPADYRRRLATFARDWHTRLIARADVLVVTSAVLAARLAADTAGRAEIHRVEPCWHVPPADQRHFAGLETGATLRMVHLGTASHAGALAAIAPAVGALLDRHADVTFHYVAPPEDTRLAGLASHLRAFPLPPRPWPGYRSWLPRQRFHLALYPLSDEPFDKARSANKLAEHALVGAVGIYPEGWAPARELGENCLLAPTDPSAWTEVLETALARRSELAGMAAQAAATLPWPECHAMQRNLWGQVLDVSF